MRCFIHTGGLYAVTCSSSCMAWCGEDGKPSCVFVEAAAMMGAVSAHALGQAVKPVTKHPPSAPPPEVKS